MFLLLNGLDENFGRLQDSDYFGLYLVVGLQSTAICAIPINVTIFEFRSPLLTASADFDDFETVP